ncbi:hypothetical protein J6590_010905 [Homalodisca vitripennis]|nr:hypothetical protein J6590_010905 [Homalodisca vitripennis]
MTRKEYSTVIEDQEGISVEYSTIIEDQEGIIQGIQGGAISAHGHRHVFNGWQTTSPDIRTSLI